jgi:oxygen-independent coproporphyrinogen-3 oxidase
MMNALRLRDGVSEALFTERTGLPLSILSPQLEQLRAQGLLDASRLQLSARGFMFLNSALEAWLPD